MEEDEARKRIREIEERKKTLEQGEKEFRKGEGILGREESELRKEIKIDREVRRDERKWNALFGRNSEKSMLNYGLYAIAVIIILIIAIYLRTTLTKFWGFYEPDDFYHFSVIRAAVNNNFFIPVNLSISGWPQHAGITEPKGLYWVTLVPYFFLRFVGISYYNVERYISVVYGLLDILGAYLLARLLSKDKFFLLLVIALVALSSGDAARTSALIYRGDSFVTIFLIGALLFFAYVFKSRSRQEKVIFAVLSGLSLSLTNFVWNGAPFVTLIYIGSLLLVLLISFINKREEMLMDVPYIFGSLAVWFIMVNLFILGGQIWPHSQILTGTGFLLLYAMLIVGWYILSVLIKRNYIGSRAGRLLLIAVFVALGLVGVYAAAPGLISSIVINNGLIVTNSFSATIQELTPPTYSFLFASFGYTLYTSPMAIIMTLPAVLLHNVPPSSILRTELDLLFWIIMLAGFIPYLFMKAYDTGGFLGGNARLRLGLDASLIVLIVYFATTAFLQIYAIRFNSLIAVPLAVFGAYTIYWVTLFSKRFEITRVAGTIAVFFVALILWSSVLQNHFGSSAALLALSFVIALLLAALVYQASGSSKRYEIAGYAITVVLLTTLLYYDLVFSASVAPADSMNPQFYGAMGWLKNNSAQSSVVLTLWPDGSVVEGVANRTSIMDSVGSQDSEKSQIFALWLFNSSADPQFLTSDQMGSPNYLVVRYVWLFGESVGIFQESELNASTEDSYAFAPLTSFNEQTNATSEVFRFTNGQSGSGAINAVAQINSNNSIYSYIDEGSGRISPFSYIAFEDQSTGNFSIVRQTAFNVTNNQMLLMEYSDIPNPQLKGVNVTGALILAPGLAQSNLAKFLFFCNANTCEWNNNEASLKLVYANSDTRIFRIMYNSTS